MITPLWTLVQKKYPFRLRLLGYGAVGGGLMSLTRLMSGQSADLATTAGLASFVSIAVGIWMGTTLAKWALGFTIRRILAVLSPVREVLENLKPSMVEQEPGERRLEAKRLWQQRVWDWCVVDLPVFLLIIVPTPALLVLLDLGYGLYDLSFWRPAALGAGALTLGSLVGQQLAIWRIARRLARWPRLADTKLSPQPMAQQTRERPETWDRQQILSWQEATRTVSSWIERITGVPVDEASPEGFPGTAA